MPISARQETPESPVASARHQAWDVMRRLRRFTVEELTEACEIDGDNARAMLRRMGRNGYVRSERQGLKGEQGFVLVYELVREPDGECLPWAVRAAERLPWRQQAWNTMRLRGRFTVPQLQVTFTEPIKRDTVQAWLRRLEKAGYVRRTGRVGENGSPGSYAIYVLLRDEATRPPSLETLKREVQHAN